MYDKKGKKWCKKIITSFENALIENFKAVHNEKCVNKPKNDEANLKKQVKKERRSMDIN